MFILISPSSISVSTPFLATHVPIVACDSFNYFLPPGTPDLEVTQEGWDLISPEGKDTSDLGGQGMGLSLWSRETPEGPGVKRKGPRMRKG